MITLYHAPKSRSSRFIWLLEEIGEPYTLHTVSIRRSDGSGAKEGSDYRRIHPHGKVPAIVDDGVAVFESAAIACYLGDLYPKAKLAPQIGDPRRGPYLTWLAYYTGVLEPAFVGKALGFAITNSTTGWASTDEVLGYIGEHLSRGPFLMGEQFTTADVLFGSTFALFGGTPLMPLKDPFVSYVERLKKRPAYERASAKDGG
jgi:glutathione S-transferase